MLPSIKYLTRAICDVAAPSVCLSCGVLMPEDVLCRRCLKETRQLLPPLCKKCWLPLAAKRSHRDCRAEFKPCSFVLSAAPFNSPLGALVKSYKYHENRKALQVIKHVFMSYIESVGKVYLHGYDAVAAVPMHWSKRLIKGFDHAEELASAAADIIGLPLHSRVLHKTRFSFSQTSKSRHERRTAPEGSIVCANPAAVKKKNILVVDDIFTTGATALACAAALKNAGARKVGILSVLRTI